ncbi:MAG TPA: hypothetical protein VHA76_07025 [Solirubrobacterales bacterium]|nr:hypothetical protein [Solirubrobacterales bacterium]
MALAAAAIAFAPGMAAAAAATLSVVATGGADSGDCVTSPCATIKYAVGQAAAGDTIEVGPGTYAENLTVSKEVSLRGANAGIAGDGGARGAETVIDGGAGRALVVSAPNVSLDGFTITGGAGGIYATVGERLHVRNDIVRSSQGRGVTLASGSAAVMIERNVIEGLIYGLTTAGGEYPHLRIADNSLAVGEPTGYALFNDGEGTFPGLELLGNAVDGMSNIGGSVEGGIVSGNRFEAGSGELALQIDLHESTVSGNSFEGDGTGGCLQIFGSQYNLDPSADATVSGNSFHGCDPYAIQLSPDLEGVTITGNTITDSYDGINTRLLENEAPWTVDGEGVSIVGNRIVGIGHQGIDNRVEGTLVAGDNWWGCNAGPSLVGGNGCAPISAGVQAGSWLVLTTTAPDSIHPDEGATVRAAIDTDSSGAHVAAVPDGTPVAYSTDLGSLDPAAATTIAGAADTHLTSPVTGVATVAATVDNQTVTSTVRVEAPPAVTPPQTPASPAPVAAPQVHIAGGGSPVQVSNGGAVTVASVACPEGSCRIAIQQRKIKIGGQGFPLKLKLDKTLGAGESTHVTAVLPARARKALAASGKGQAIIRLRLYSAAGMEEIPIHVRLKGPKSGR